MLDIAQARERAAAIAAIGALHSATDEAYLRRSTENIAFRLARLYHFLAGRYNAYPKGV